jgi:hypothetical protein
VPAGEAAGWLLAMRAAYLSGSVQMVCNRFAGLRAHYGIEWRMLDTATSFWLLVPCFSSCRLLLLRPSDGNPFTLLTPLCSWRFLEYYWALSFLVLKYLNSSMTQQWLCISQQIKRSFGPVVIKLLIIELLLLYSI